MIEQAELIKCMEQEHLKFLRLKPFFVYIPFLQILFNYLLQFLYLDI